MNDPDILRKTNTYGSTFTTQGSTSRRGLTTAEAMGQAIGLLRTGYLPAPLYDPQPAEPTSRLRRRLLVISSVPAVYLWSGPFVVFLHEAIGHLVIGRLPMHVSGAHFAPYRIDPLGFTGVAFPYETISRPNSLGRELGCNGESALMSVAGIIPPALISSVLLGNFLRSKFEETGPLDGFTTWFSAAHLVSSLSYVFSALRSSRYIKGRIEEVDCAALGFPGSGKVWHDRYGHDFLSLSANKQQVLAGRGYSLTPLQVSILMSTIISCLTIGSCIIGVMLRLANESHDAPRADVLARWAIDTRDGMQRVNPEFLRLAEQYPRAAELNQAITRINHCTGKYDSSTQLEIRESLAEMDRFWSYAHDKIPPRELSSLRSQVIGDWNQAASPNQLERLLRIGAAFGVGTAFLQPLISLFGDTTVEEIGPLGRALRGNSPLLMAPLATLSGVSGLKTVTSDLPATVKLVTAMQAAVSLSALWTLMKVSPRTRSSHFDNFVWSCMVPFIATFAYLTLSCARRFALRAEMRRKRAPHPLSKAERAV